jgi:phosphatidylglycerophosphate synthase
MRDAAPLEGQRTGVTAVLLPPTPMSFCVVAGLPIVQRVALSALRGGFDAVVALAPGDGAALRAVLARDPRTATIPVVADTAGASIASEYVALVPSDCVVTTGALARASSAEVNGRPVRFGAVGAGIVVAPRRALGATPSEAGLRDGELCLRVTDAGEAAAAEDALLATLGSPSDGPIARFDRALSTRISRHLVRTPLRPNHITTIGTCIGFAGAWGLAQGSYLSGVLGALLFWLAVIVDGCDGEVARLKFLESRFGYWYDITTDNIVHAAVFAGLGIGLYRADASQPFLLLGALLVGGLIAATAVTLTLLVADPPADQPPPRSRRGRWRRRLLRGFEALMNRDFAYLLLLLAVVGRLHWFLCGAAVGTYVYAGALVLVHRWRDAD